MSQPKIDKETAAFNRLALAVDNFLRVQGWRNTVLDQGSGVLQTGPDQYGLVVAFTGQMKEGEEAVLWPPK
jgi:hypothetical protein